MATITANEDKYAKLISKQCADLEDLAKRLLEIQTQKQTDLVLDQNESMISDDCLELQKFCAKLEFLLQFKLKEKKSLLSSDRNLSLNSSNQTESTNKEYWSFLLEVLKSSRSFQDAIKYVKNLNEIKTNLGRGRAFIRFCLHYHRLADAIQQLMMEEKSISYWYHEKAVWYDSHLKSQIFQLLYDINEVNFDLLSKNNFELDTQWPSGQTTNKFNKISRNRTASLSSFNFDAYSVYNNQTSSNANDPSLLSSTPLEMDDELSKLNQSQEEDNYNDSVSVRLTSKSLVDDTTLAKLNLQVESLTEQLNFKTKQNTDLNNCLLKQTTLSENLSDLLKTNQIRTSELEANIEKISQKYQSLQNDYDTLTHELNSVKFELSAKTIQEENLVKETLAQTQSIINLKQMCSQQELQINQLKSEYNSIKSDRQNEVESHQKEIQKLQVQLQLKEEENYLLNDQIQKLSKSLDDERKEKAHTSKEITDLKQHYKQMSEKMKKQIDQLEADNNEIKKRLVKLIKEKAELWQKADNLEYENLLKTNAMWVDDASISKCMSCQSTFSLMLRKSLKINLKTRSQLRVCQRCFEAKLNMSRPKSTSVASGPNDLESEARGSNASELNSRIADVDDNDDEEDDDPDINFEVRSEKLNISAEQLSSDLDDLNCIYKSNNSNSSHTLTNNINNNNKSLITKSNDDNNKDEIKQNKIEIDKQEADRGRGVTQTDDAILAKQLAKNVRFQSGEQEEEEEDEADVAGESSDLIVRRKKVLKKKKPTQQSQPTQRAQINCDSLDDDYDTFAIVSQEEIDKV